jgi:hypothetical protein
VSESGTRGGLEQAANKANTLNSRARKKVRGITKNLVFNVLKEIKGLNAGAN